jgi:AraC family transcriptional regulator
MNGAAEIHDEISRGLLAILSRRTGARHATPQRHQGGLAPWQVRRVTEYMDAHLDQPIALAELAALIHLSRFHFCTAFRIATGHTPLNWLTDRRIDRAVLLLADHRRSITEIALEVGYETPSSFTARFRQRMGVTPSDYRRALQD